MTKKDDLIAALEKRRPAGAVPIWELEFQAWDAASGRHLWVGENFCSLTDGAKERAIHENAEIMLDVSVAMNYAALSVPNGFWEIAPGVPSYYWLPGKWRYKQAALLRHMAPPDLVLVAIASGILGMPLADHYMDFACQMYDAPEEVDALAQRTLSAGLEAAAQFRDLGMEMIVSASDIADNRGLYFNPRQLRRFVLPYLHSFATGLKAMGLYCILHTDGNLNSCLEDLAESGVDGLQAIDPTAGMDMYATKQRVAGRLCLCGNIDCGLLLTALPQDVYEATRSLLITCKDGGGLVLGASNAIQAEVPMANYRAMIQAWVDYGKYS